MGTIIFIDTGLYWFSFFSCASKPSCTTLGGVKIVHRIPSKLGVGCDDHLCNSHAILNDEIFLPVIDEQNTHITAVICVDRSRVVIRLPHV